MADEVKFTPGPWRFDPSSRDYGHPEATIAGTIIAPGLTHVAVLPGDIHEAEDNARLIAAAPDLLAALQRLIHPDGGEEDDIRAARAAITKATQA